MPRFLLENNISIDSFTLLQNYKDENWYMAEEDVVFQTLGDCKAFNIANSFPEMDCGQYQKLDGSIWYRAEHGICIMQDDGDQKVNNFQRYVRVWFLLSMTIFLIKAQ